ncbi:hypothetical protein CY34DRAFT_156746 [Suillus luteus UH-Slu-Lm8-n1]|uniref:Uncharacterized protein n=1 Tax=Suillus luteus UH-Slu-Lm8-n1 TaxID=930992 RepID=A0A0D0AWL7_9AGAM|nr:hypothetical protein CY34DRAFT_156746 [Suillus luteus UH-Slu-Lm8-n1]
MKATINVCTCHVMSLWFKLVSRSRSCSYTVTYRLCRVRPNSIHALAVTSVMSSLPMPRQGDVFNCTSSNFIHATSRQRVKLDNAVPPDTNVAYFHVTTETAPNDLSWLNDVHEFKLSWSRTVVRLPQLNARRRG